VSRRGLSIQLVGTAPEAIGMPGIVFADGDQAQAIL
jgi:hypothetical protein